MATTMMNTMMGDTMTVLWDACGMEVLLLAFFGLGYLVFNCAMVQKLLARPDAQDALVTKQMAADLSSGNYEEALRRSAGLKSVGLDALCMAMTALVELGRASEAWCKAQEVFSSVAALHTTASMNAVLEILAGHCDLLKQASEFLTETLKIEPDAATTGILMQAFTDALRMDEVRALIAKGAACPARTFVALVKDSLKRGDLAAAGEVLQQMQSAGLFLPSHLLASVLRSGASRDASFEILAQLGLSGESVTALLDVCCRDHQAALVERVLALAEGPLPQSAYEAAVKCYAKSNDAKAFKYLAEVPSVTTSFAVQVAALCVDTRNTPLAERLLQAARTAGSANLTLYSGVMKVYATTRQFQKTCDLYAQLTDDGLVPDTIMYGGLIKAAVECGQLEMSRQLLKDSGTLDIQNYMSLFRACGRERNARKALDLLKELEASDVGIDTTAYNCVLDVCMKSGDMRAVTELFAKMKILRYVDVISFNTLLKGAGRGGLDALQILEDMRALQLVPNQVTYNSLINAAVTKRNVALAWTFVDEMEKAGIEVDNFTCSIMMKGLKHTSSRDDVDKTLRLIERSHVCPDEVLVNTLLDACIRLRDVKRLTSALNTFRHSGVVPSEHAYGTLIRAYGQARCLDQAKSMWTDMLERQVRPSEATFGSMIEACVNNGALDDALAALKEMRTQIPDFSTPQQIYATLIKGFSHRRETGRVMEIYEDLKADGVQLDLMTFNCLLDACARGGDMERCSSLFREMCVQGVTPDLVTYSTVIKGYCVLGDLEQAVQLFTLMRKRDIQPDAILFNSILDGCARKQMTSISEMMLADMERSGVPPSNQTLSILVKMYGKAHDLETAMQLAERLPRQYSFDVNTQSQTALLAACVTNGRLTQAFEVFREIRHADAKTFQTLITGCLKNHDVPAALDTLGEALRAGQRVEAEVVDSVVFMANRRRCGDKLQAVMPLLQANGYAVNGSTSPREASKEHSKVHARRQASQSWRDVSSDSE